MFVRTILFLLLLFISTVLNGQKKDYVFIHPFSNSIGITLEGGLTFSETDFNSGKLDYGGRGLLEYFFYSNSVGTFGLRLYGGLAYVGGENGVHFDGPEIITITELRTAIYNIGGGYSYTLSINDLLFPYLSLGLSYIQYYPRGNNNKRIPALNEEKSSNNNINYDVEFGTRVLIHKNFSFNLSGTIHFNPSDNLDGFWINDDDDIFYSLNFGIGYYFNDAKDSDADGIDDSEDFCPDTPPHFEVDKFGCPIDEDKDGVPDQNDLCLDTKIGVIVDDNGCAIDLDRDGIPDSLDLCRYTPAGTVVDEFGCPVDVDKDGVPDSLDQCLYTPEDVEVDSVGCPIDNDKDGIVDYLDKCLNTPPGTLVDSNGCPDIIYDKTFDKVVVSNFMFGEDSLPNEAFSLLDELLIYILENPNLKWRIEGHSDSISEDCEDNYILSLSRAEKVYNYLIKKGASKINLSILGFSDFQPAADNNSPEGRKLNRRVEIIKLRY